MKHVHSIYNQITLERASKGRDHLRLFRDVVLDLLAVEPAGEMLLIIYIYIYICIHISIYPYIHINKQHVYIYIYIYTHIHTHE